MYFHTLGTVVLLASLQLVATAPTSDGGPVTSEAVPASSDPAPFSTTAPKTTFSSTSTADVTSSTVTATAVSPGGGGQTCVQQCLALAAVDAGCNGFDDSQCVCASSTFIGEAQNCFNTQQCDPSAATGASRDYFSVCRNLSMSSDSTSTTDTTTISSTTTSTQPITTESTVTRTSPSSTRLPESTVHTVETFIIQSGAVITVSGAVYTAKGAATTTFSGQLGDFAAGTGVATLGANDDVGSGTSVPNSGVPMVALGSAFPITAMTMVVGTIIGGLACLVI